MNDAKPHRSVIWSARSRRDLEGIRAYIGQYAPLTAQRFTARLVAAAESLAAQPDRGRRANGLRELVAISPYVIRYSVSDDAVEIVTIWRGARRTK